MSNRSYSEVGVQVSITSCLVGAKNYSECQLNTSDSSCNRKNALFISCYPPRKLIGQYYTLSHACIYVHNTVE